MIPGGLPIPVPTPSLACPNGAPSSGAGVASCHRLTCVMRVQHYVVDDSVRANCTVIELGVHASMDP
jgi:hypothetical protein